jgi:alkylated DNA repair dioxygenase AlkB
MQQPLFPIESSLPDGFSYFPDFINEEEEIQLLETISSLELRPLIFQGFTAKRRVQSYGYDYNFDRRSVAKGTEIPSGFTALISKVAGHFSMKKDELAEVLITEYPPDAVINWHRDAPPFDIVIGISLLSDCMFRFRPYDKSKQGRKSIASLTVQRRSMYILKGESRTEWEHSIAPVKEKRYSITLRTLRFVSPEIQPLL